MKNSLEVKVNLCHKSISIDVKGHDDSEENVAVRFLDTRWHHTLQRAQLIPVKKH